MAFFSSRSHHLGSAPAAHLSAAALAVFSTFAAFGAVLAPAPAAAQSGPYYVAELAQPAKDIRAVAGGVAWRCAETTCVAPKASSRPLRVCRDLQRKVGPLASFTAKGEVMDAESLARCND